MERIRIAEDKEIQISESKYGFVFCITIINVYGEEVGVTLQETAELEILKNAINSVLKKYKWSALILIMRGNYGRKMYLFLPKFRLINFRRKNFPINHIIWIRNKITDSNCIILPKFNGYIVQFEDKPVIEKKNELDKESKVNKKYVDEAFILNPRRIYRQLFSVMPEDVNKKIRDYREDIKKKDK